MSQLLIHPFFRSKPSNTEGSSKYLKKQYSSPQLDDYQNVSEKYSNYLNTLDSKIDTICEKERQRNCFKEQKLNTIKNQLLKKKHSLQRQLTEKMDPTKTDNGKIYLEITELNKLEASYLEILENLEKSVREREEEIQRLQELINKQKINIKENIKENFIKSASVQRFKLPKLNLRNDSSILSHSSVYSSKTRESFLSRLHQSWSQKINQSIDTQEQKLIILKLLCVYIRSQPTETFNHTIGVIDSIERDIKEKEELLEQIKQLNTKQSSAKITSQ